jgi:hypothetical protein
MSSGTIRAAFEKGKKYRVCVWVSNAETKEKKYMGREREIVIIIIFDLGATHILHSSNGSLDEFTSNASSSNEWTHSQHGNIPSHVVVVVVVVVER